MKRIRRVLVESEFTGHPQVEFLRGQLAHAEWHTIADHRDYFGRVNKPDLYARRDLTLILARHHGRAVKLAPPAYGTAGLPHYYFIHQYNCAYACEYCYLQGYFRSSDLVFFLNHEDTLAEMKTLSDEHPDGIWFHAGEFSDSLAVSHLSGELPLYWNFFRENRNARLELRTKSVNRLILNSLEPLPNVTVSYSLSTEQAARRYDRLAPSVRVRLRAMSAIAARGFRIGVHFDPVIWSSTVTADYRNTFADLLKVVPEASIDYISLGVVRFTMDTWRSVRQNHPGSALLQNEFVVSRDGKVRYPRPVRLWVLRNLRDELIAAGVSEHKVYLCMEDFQPA